MHNEQEVASLERFLAEAIKGLKEGPTTCYRFEPQTPSAYAIFIGWSDGYDESDPTVIHDEDNPTWAICAGVKVDNQIVWADFDWLDFPEDEEGFAEDTAVSLGPDDDMHENAVHLLELYDYYCHH